MSSDISFLRLDTEGGKLVDEEIGHSLDIVKVPALSVHCTAIRSARCDSEQGDVLEVTRDSTRISAKDSDKVERGTYEGISTA